jgi:hypothetical protein
MPDRGSSFAGFSEDECQKIGELGTVLGHPLDRAGLNLGTLLQLLPLLIQLIKALNSEE